MDENKEAIENISKALKQVLSVDPQLLYKAAMGVAADCIIERMGAELSNKPQKAEKLLVRGALAQQIGHTLLRTGRAHLDDQDVANIATYLQFTNRDADNG